MLPCLHMYALGYSTMTWAQMITEGFSKLNDPMIQWPSAEWRSMPQHCGKYPAFHSLSWDVGLQKIDFHGLTRVSICGMTLWRQRFNILATCRSFEADTPPACKQPVCQGMQRWPQASIDASLACLLPLGHSMVSVHYVFNWLFKTVKIYKVLKKPDFL